MTATYGTLTYRETRTNPPEWVIRAQPHVMIRVKRLIPRGKTNTTGAVTVQDTLDVARDIQMIHDRWPLEMTDHTATVFAERLKQHTERQHAIDNILAGHQAPLLLTEPNRVPREYQLQFAAMIHATQRVLLADDVGLGKTTSAALILSDPAALPALVVAPTHLQRQWITELFAIWPGLVGHIITKSEPYDLRRIPRTNGHIPDVLVISYSKLAGWAHTLAGQVKTVIFDEVQELRRGVITAKGTAAANVAAEATYVAGLSASPVYNYGGEIWNIINILAKGRLGSWGEFQREWCGDTNTNGKTIVKDPAALGTYLRDTGLLLRRTRKDVRRELPDPIRIRQEITADPEAITALGGDALQMARLVLDEATNPQERFTAAGDLDWRLRQATGIAKAPYVAEWVRLLLESEEKILLFGWHRSCYDVWLQQLADFNPVLYTGSESPSQKNESVRAFIEGDARVLIMSLRAGVGLDGLQKACSVAVFGELDWSPEVHNQCLGRLARDGQEATVAAYFLVSTEGADPVMDEVLQLKRMQAEPIRDPDAPLLVPVASSVDRIKLLAKAVLDRAGG
jgi:superfamily II DNA or RNA helicase